MLHTSAGPASLFQLHLWDTHLHPWDTHLHPQDTPASPGYTGIPIRPANLDTTLNPYAVGAAKGCGSSFVHLTAVMSNQRSMKFLLALE